MSTKIYNGFRINSMNLKTQKEFVSTVKKKALEYYIKSYADVFAEKMVEFIDNLSVHDYNKDFERIELALQKHYYQQYSIAKIIRAARFGQVVDVKMKDILNILNRSYSSMYSFFKDIIEEDIKCADITNDIFSAEFDFSAEIVMLPLSNKKTLIMTYSNKFTNFFSELCDDKEFCEKYGLEDYHYQNQTDRPDSISSKDWNKRKRDWDTVLVTGIPNKDGFVINLLDGESFNYALFDHRKDAFEEMLSKIPLRSARIKTVANRIAFDKYYQDYKVEHKIEEKDASYGTVMHANREFKEKLNTGDTNVNKLLKECTDAADSFIVEITKDKLLDISVISWFPNYSKYLQEKEDNDESL